jgi:hypothetical protein
MAITQNQYTGDGTTVLFTITFPYLERDHVKASINGTPTTAFTFANSNTIQFNVAPVNGAAVLLFRETASDQLQNQFFPNSSIPSSSLNNNFTQGLYVAQETDNTSAEALSQAQTAVTTANGAVVTANAADAKSDQAVLDSSAAVLTANTAESNSLAAVSTANSASSAASAAVITANAASSAASAAVITANAADATATQASIDSAAAVVTANAADGKADSAIITANAADGKADTAIITANAADANASAAVITANTAESNSLAAVSTANAASAAVSAAQLYLPVADLTALALLTPADGDLFELTDSTGAETDPSITGVPIGLVGDAGLTFRLRYDDPPSEYAFVSYFANDSEDRYIRSGVGAIVNADVSASAAIGLSKLATGALPTGITVASANIVDGTIVNADISASAAIVDTKLATIATAGKVSNSATTAASANTLSAIVARDASGNFSAGTITANLTGNVTGNLTGTASAIADNTVTSAKIVDGAIVNADVNASAAIAGTKVAPNFGSQNVVTTGTATAASLNPTGSSVPTNGVYLPAANSVAISTSGAQRATIDSSGRLLVGTSTNIVSYDNIASVVTSHDLSAAAGFGSFRWVANAGGPVNTFNKSRGASVGTRGAVIAGDVLGALAWCGDDGTNFIRGATIAAAVDGTPGANDMPSRLVFSTTADGASSPTEVMRLTSNNYLRMASGTSGIQFNGDTAAANALDDYEEGTWTVQIFDAVSGGNLSATTSTGYYTKTGRTVSIWFQLININTSGLTAANVLHFTLPFTNNSSMAGRGMVTTERVSFTGYATSQVNSGGLSRGFLVNNVSAADDVNIIVSNFTTGTADIGVQMTYFV